MIFYRKGVRSVNKKGEEIMYDIESKINFSGNFFAAAACSTNKHSFAGILDSSLCIE